MGEHEHADGRVLGADLLRRDEPFLGVRRRHLDVDDRHVGLGQPDRAQQLRAVRGAADDVEAGVAEQPRETFAHQHLVVGDHEPHGISARQLSPATINAPSTAPIRSSSSATSPPTAAPSTSTTQPTVGARGAHADRAAAARQVGDKEVRGGLDRGEEALVGQRAEAHRRVADLGERLDRSGESFVGQHRRVDAAGELAQLVERGAQLGDGGVDLIADLGAQQPQREREHHQPLLGAVVEIALEPAALGIAGLDGTGARRAQLLQAGSSLRLQPLVVERQPGGSARSPRADRGRRAARRDGRSRRRAGRRARAA